MHSPNHRMLCTYVLRLSVTYNEENTSTIVIVFSLPIAERRSVVVAIAVHEHDGRTAPEWVETSAPGQSADLKCESTGGYSNI